MNQLGVELETNKPAIKNIIDTILDLDNKMPEIGNNIDNAYDASVVLHQYIQNVQGDMPTISDALNKTEAIAQSNSDNLNKMQTSLNTLVTSLKAQQEVIRKSEDNTKLLLTNVQNYSPIDFSNANQILNIVDGSVSNSINKMDNNITYLKAIEDGLKKNGDVNSVVAIDRLINDLTNIKNDLQNQRSNVKNTIELINTGADSIQKLVPVALNEALDNANQTLNSINNVVDDFNNNTVPAMQNTMANFVGISDNTLSLLRAAQGNLPLINSLLSMSEYGAGEGEKALLDMKNKFPEVQNIVHKNADKLKSLDEDKRYDEVVKLLKKNAKDESEFLAEPVKLTENKIYTIHNYGSAMSPFYTTLAIWVGSFIVLALLSVEVNDFEDGTAPGPIQLPCRRTTLDS
jgi:putative membrane protein